MSAAAEAPPSLDEIDRLLREIAADGAVLSWGEDRPLLPSEARAVMERHRADPSSVAVGRSRETVFASETQLRQQAASFTACAAALRAADPALIPAGNPMGSGHAEVLELLVDAEELRALLVPGSAEAAALDEEHRDLADAFDAAASVCLAQAVTMQGERHRLHHADYQRLLVEALRDEEEERARRRRHTAKAEGTGA